MTKKLIYSYDEVINMLMSSKGEICFVYELNPLNDVHISKHNQYGYIVVAWGNESTYCKFDYLSKTKQERLKKARFTM